MLNSAAIAALLASIGDFLMLTTATGRSAFIGDGAHGSTLLMIGGALGTAAIPFYFLGYGAIARALRPTARAATKATLVGGAIVAIAGALTHALTAADIHTALAAGAATRLPSEAFRPAFTPLYLAGTIATVAAVTAAAAIGWGARGSPLLWIRRAALLNPVVLTLLLALTGTLAGALADLLIPAAPNLAHCIFFLACDRWRRAEERR